MSRLTFHGQAECITATIEETVGAKASHFADIAVLVRYGSGVRGVGLKCSSDVLKLEFFIFILNFEIGVCERRSGAQTKAIETRFVEQRIPYVTVGTNKFFEREEVLKSRVPECSVVEHAECMRSALGTLYRAEVGGSVQCSLPSIGLANVRRVQSVQCITL
jgi:hypothetical protein